MTYSTNAAFPVGSSDDKIGRIVLLKTSQILSVTRMGNMSCSGVNRTGRTRMLGNATGEEPTPTSARKFWQGLGRVTVQVNHMKFSHAQLPGNMYTYIISFAHSYNFRIFLSINQPSVEAHVSS